ncbi:MAG: M23 family metallopeptidase [Acidobacteria bacterium]|nr:M23 family metallopeptidase [Acidobacteriota bacterium]
MGPIAPKHRAKRGSRADQRTTCAVAATVSATWKTSSAATWEQFWNNSDSAPPHHGVDIFAPRGTPVLAAAGGIVTSGGTSSLGGNVVWIARPGRREAHYYAHLDRQLVTPGTFVEAGDVIGTVGNTGNARGTLPH